MKIILVNQDHSRTRSITACGRKLAIAASLAVAGIMGLGGGAVYSWLALNSSGMLTSEGIRNWQQTLDRQRDELVAVRADAERQVNALTLRLAELQGRLTRLDALGERLTAKSSLDDGEFDFNAVPAVGGPEDVIDISLIQARPSLLEAIDELASQIDNREQQLDLLDRLIANQHYEDDAFIAGTPVRSGEGWVSSRYGRRTDPFTGRSSWHNGFDIAGPVGTDIMAVAGGVVIFSGTNGGFGLFIEINHGNGYTTRYAHCDELLVKIGDVVSRGQLIAKMGNTGRSTGPHLHLEVHKDGKSQDPAKYIYRAGLLDQQKKS